MSTWALALNYLFHLLATVIWLGGMATLTLVAWPGLRRALGDSEQVDRAAEALRQRMQPMANVSLAVLLVTGLIQMSGDPHYVGFLAIKNAWDVTLLIKHIIVGLMIAVTAAMQIGVQPALGRAALLARRSESEGRTLEARLHHRLRYLSRLNLALGVLVLICTAFLTAL